MDDLFRRIEQAYPKPLVLTADETDLLDVWLFTHKPSFSGWMVSRGGTFLDELDWQEHLTFVVEYNRLRRTRALPAGSQSPDVLPAEAVSQGDRPDECGYVERPADPAAYVPAARILAEHTPAGLAISMKELAAILGDYDTNRIRWTRPLARNGRPMRNRRSVHLGDWAAYLKRRLPDDPDGFPRLSEAELESRRAAVRNSRHAGK